MIVLDTSALIFWTLDPQRLSQKAQHAIQQADRILVSAISIGGDRTQGQAPEAGHPSDHEGIGAEAAQGWEF